MLLVKLPRIGVVGLLIGFCAGCTARDAVSADTDGSVQDQVSIGNDTAAPDSAAREDSSMDDGHAAGDGANPLDITPADAGSYCRNLQCFQNRCMQSGCKVQACPNGGTTSLSGVIYDPAGIHPVYNVIVYVPNAAVEEIPTGATCDRCGRVSGEPLTSTLTNSKGEFRLDNVPVTANVPLVFQVGKWRRQLTIPSVTNCADTQLARLRLPRNSTEGHLPRIALATGGAGPLECLLRKIGISDSEMTPETGPGRVNFYAGQGGTARWNPALHSGTAFTAATTFWESLASLMTYDMVVLSCEGIERSTNKSDVALQAMQDYTSAGGRVFLSHWHNYWLEFGPAPFPTVAAWSHQPDPSNPFVGTIDTVFPKGLALAAWLVSAGSSAPFGQLIIIDGKNTLNRQTDGVSQRWISSTSPVSVQALSLNTPVGQPEDKQCGRIMFSDIHSSTLDISSVNTSYPNGCTTTTMTDQEKALEFMLFDLSSCVISDNTPPRPPQSSPSPQP
jgi:hypothetical protein